MTLLLCPTRATRSWGVGLSSAVAERWRRRIARLAAVETLTRMALSFLLVFRLGRSAVRFWEARQKAGAMIEVKKHIEPLADSQHESAATEHIKRLNAPC